MTAAPVPDDLRRFILTSIASVPHLEALLLLRAQPERDWDSETVARRLYITCRAADKLLNELCEIGALAVTAMRASRTYGYHPQHAELADMIDRLAAAYVANLVGISGLIHSKLDRQAQQFADAFTWRKDG